MNNFCLTFRYSQDIMKYAYLNFFFFLYTYSGRVEIVHLKKRDMYNIALRSLFLDLCNNLMKCGI